MRSSRVRNYFLLDVEPRRHRSEQYLTCSQSRAHFLRHSNGRLHTGHTFVGFGDRCFEEAIRVDLPEVRFAAIARRRLAGESTRPPTI